MIEVKVHDPNKSWEETPVKVKAHVLSRDEAYVFCEAISKAYKTEVRWNYEGSFNGTYVGTMRRFGIGE